MDIPLQTLMLRGLLLLLGMMIIVEVEVGVGMVVGMGVGVGMVVVGTAGEDTGVEGVMIGELYPLTPLFPNPMRGSLVLRMSYKRGQGVFNPPLSGLA